MSLFNQFVFSQQASNRNGIMGGLSLLAGKAAKYLLILGLLLGGLGVLALKYPEVVAVIVAVILFFGAFMCLSFAWKIFISSRVNRPGAYKAESSTTCSDDVINVEVIDSE